MAQAVFDTKALVQNITLHVQLKRATQWRWRIQLGLWLIRLAAWVMWLNIEIEMED